MKAFMLVLVLISFSLCSSLMARKKDGPWPPFQVGVTGIMARPEKEKILPVTVAEITAGTPAAGKLEVGDVILAVNGAKLEAPDPRVALGDAITAAEASDGRLVFQVERKGEREKVGITIPAIGAYSATWPVDCPKTKKIVGAAADRSMEIITSQKNTTLNRTSAMHALFLLSTGENRHLEAVARLMKDSAPLMTKVRGHTWNNGYMLIAMSEYYLRTGDKVVLPPMKVIVDDSFERDCVGGWGHWDYLNPGYVRSGLVNAAGGGLFVGIVLARECGIEMKDEDFERSLRYFYRFAGYGGTPYGDQRPSGGGSTNGKSGMTSAALSLLNEPYASFSKAVALEQADSYEGFEGGHTGNFTNMMWRALSIPNLPESKKHHYRRHQDKLRWYYELCRQPGGGFRMLPAMMKNDRYANEDYGMTVALSYTAGWGKLRLTGAKPGKLSQIKPMREVIHKNSDFARLDHAEGYKVNDFEAELRDIVSKMTWSARGPFYSHRSVKKGSPEQLDSDEKLPSLADVAKYLRHSNPLVRCQAACAIGYYGDEALPEIKMAIQSEDARVRQAGLRGLSGYMTFFMEKSPFTYSEKSLSEMVPLIVEVLKSPKADIWELDAALWALSTAPPEDIVKQFELLVPLLKHDEWWVRTAAFLAVCETGAEAAPLVPDLIECFVREEHGWPREYYHRVLKTLLREEKPRLTEETRKQLVRWLGDDFVGGNYSRDYAYTMRGNWFYEHRNCHILLSFQPKELALVAEQVNQVLANMGDAKMAKEMEGEPAFMILNGDKSGGPGLLNMIAKIEGKDQAKFLPGLKALLAGGLDVMASAKKKGGSPEDLKKTKGLATSILESHKGSHSIKPYPARKISFTNSGR